MANPPKKPTGTTPPRRKAASRKATPPKSLAPEALTEGDESTPETVAPAAPKKPRAQRAAAAAKAPAKPRAAKRPEPARAAPRAPARQRSADSTPAQYVADTRERMGDRNFFAAVIGATAAIGAALAGVFLATRTRAEPADESKPNAGGSAHQPDGTDSSASFEAAIADEHTIPDQLPRA